MRVMVIVKASQQSEAGVMPDTGLLEAMGRFNEALIEAGVMLAGEGLRPTSKGARVRFSGSGRTVTRGPFGNPEAQVAGFWLWRVRSMEEAIDWIGRAPFEDAEIELRPLFEPEDFGAELTPEMRAREERQRARAEQLARGPH